MYMYLYTYSALYEKSCLGFGKFDFSIYLIQINASCLLLLLLVVTDAVVLDVVLLLQIFDCQSTSANKMIRILLTSIDATTNFTKFTLI